MRVAREDPRAERFGGFPPVRGNLPLEKQEPARVEPFKKKSGSSPRKSGVELRQRPPRRAVGRASCPTLTPRGVA